MTVQEAIMVFGMIETHGSLPTKAKEVAIKCMEEVEQYRALGTVEELKVALMKVSVYEQIKWERDIAISQLEEIGISLGQKMDDVKEALEKQIPKKVVKIHVPNTSFCKSHYREICPTCSKAYEGTDYCPMCGQKLDWEEGGTSDR